MLKNHSVSTVGFFNFGQEFVQASRFAAIEMDSLFSEASQSEDL